MVTDIGHQTKEGVMLGKEESIVYGSDSYVNGLNEGKKRTR
jgi:hypothetical protein